MRVATVLSRFGWKSRLFRRWLGGADVFSIRRARVRRCRNQCSNERANQCRWSAVQDYDGKYCHAKHASIRLGICTNVTPGTNDKRTANQTHTDDGSNECAHQRPQHSLPFHLGKILPGKSDIRRAVGLPSDGRRRQSSRLSYQASSFTRSPPSVQPLAASLLGLWRHHPGLQGFIVDRLVS